MAQTEEAVPPARRRAPYWEWVEMYRRGIEPAKIADVCGVAQTTVRYHLQIAAKADPGLRGEHAAVAPVKLPSDTTLQRMHDLVAFYRQKGVCRQATRNPPGSRPWLAGCAVGGGNQQRQPSPPPFAKA